MLAMIMEAIIFWAVFFGMLVVGFVLTVALAYVMVTIEAKRQRKEWNNRYYNRH